MRVCNWEEHSWFDSVCLFYFESALQGDLGVGLIQSHPQVLFFSGIGSSSLILKPNLDSRLFGVIKGKSSFGSIIWIRFLVKSADEGFQLICEFGVASVYTLLPSCCLESCLGPCWKRVMKSKDSARSLCSFLKVRKHIFQKCWENPFVTHCLKLAQACLL